MPQEFYVLKCFSCETFQVHIVKKAKKWECKMCGAKQSLKRNYGKGSSKDCRNQVMKLNELRLSKSNLNQTEDEIFDETWDDSLTEEPIKEESKEPKPSVSKWAEYVEENEPESEVDDNDDNFLLEAVDKKKKRMKKMSESYFKNKKVCRESSEVFSNNCDEADESCYVQNNEICDQTEQKNFSKNFIQVENKSKLGKYAKYLQDEEDNNESIKEVDKMSNIFESNLTDLDDVLNF